MKKILFILSFCFAYSAVFAVPAQPVLNVVGFQFQDEQWVTTESAKVIVAIDVSTDTAGLSTVRDHISQKLKKLSKNADWHITTFIRAQDQSGLERVSVKAEARISRQDLSKLRDIAKSMSKPGFTVSIADIQFTPNHEAMQQAKIALRMKIYKKIASELTQLNSIYPQQHFVLHKINFIASNEAPQPQMLATFATRKNSTGGTSQMLVSTKVYAMAHVEFAAQMANNLKGA